MRKILPLFLFLFFINKEIRANCDPAFTFTTQNSTVFVQANNTAPHLFHRWHFEGPYQYGASGLSLSHTYTAPGTYTITHWVTDTVNYCIDSMQRTVTVTGITFCNAGFIISQSPDHYNEYSFTNTSGLPNVGTVSYSWSINGTQVAQTPNMTYSFPHGTHNVCLSLSGSAGCASSACRTVTVYDTTICNWSASFVATPSTTVPKQFSFTPTPSLDRMQFNWNFGDGYSSSQKTPVHTYAQAGTYNVRLAILDTLTGCPDTVIHQIQVQGSPSDSCYAFFIQSADAARPNEITFIAASNQPITSQLWVINNWNSPDSIVISSNDPTYLFTDTGRYYVCLYITTNTGCTQRYCDIINVDSIGSRVERIPCYPNPTRGSVALRLRVTENRKVKISIYNLSGYAVYQTEINCIRGTNEIILPAQNLTAGQYFIDIKYGDQRKRSIFQKF